MTGPLDGVQLHLVDSIDEAAAMKRWLGERRDVLAYDLETTGLRRYRDGIRLAQLGDVNHGWAVPWERWGGVFVECVNAYEGQLVAHNALFDDTFLRRSNVELPHDRTDDTMVMAHILDSTRPVALKTLTSLLIDRRAASAQGILDQIMTNNGWGWDTVPIDLPEYWSYGALDTVLTCHLWQILKPQVMADAPKAYDLEMAMTWVAQGMERKGCYVDLPYTQEKLTAFTRYVEQAEDWCVANYGVKPGSNQPVIERLKRDGIEFWKYTPAGQLALDKEVLEGIIATTGHPLAETVLQRRRLQKLASTYLSNFINLAHDDGRLRPNIRVLGARTGRMSIAEPALQTLPRRSEDNPAAITVRNCITATPGNTLIMCDWDQIEMRMFAHFAEDPAMIAAFAEGDYFTNVARELYGDPTLRKKDPRRQLTKNGSYALGYGAGAEKIALTTGQSLDRVTEFLALLAQRLPGIKRLQRQVGDVAMQRKRAEGSGYVRSPLTNRKHVADDGKEYALVNFLIQGTACELFKAKNIELAQAGLDEYLILDVHDEVILDVPNDIIDDVEPLVKQIMEDSTFRVPFTAGVDRSFRWGDKAA